MKETKTPLTNKQRRAAKKLFTKLPRNEQPITPEFIASLPASR